MLQRLRLHAAQHGGAAAFHAVAMRHLAGDEFLAALAVAHDADQIALRAGGDKERVLKAHHAGDLLLQCVDARVIAKDIVAQRRGHHGGTHALGGARHSVAAQIDCLGGRLTHGACSRKFFSSA